MSRVRRPGTTSLRSLQGCPAICRQQEPRRTTSGKRWRRQPIAWRSVEYVLTLSTDKCLWVSRGLKRRCSFSLGSIVSRYVQLYGQRNWLCKLLPDGKYSTGVGFDFMNRALLVHHSRSGLSLMVLADRSPGRVPQEVIRAASEYTAPDQSSSGWVSHRLLARSHTPACFQIWSFSHTIGNCVWAGFLNRFDSLCLAQVALLSYEIVYSRY